MDHAEQVRDALNKLNADLNVANYAVRIVSEEADAKTLLEKFQAVEKPTPVIATTVDLLTTGVDAPSVRNIVFFKSVASPTVFKQMVGRGSRLCEDTDKYWFRIIDYTGATELFDEWDAPTPPSEGGARRRAARLLAGRHGDLGRGRQAAGGCGGDGAAGAERNHPAAHRVGRAIPAQRAAGRPGDRDRSGLWAQQRCK